MKIDSVLAKFGPLNYTLNLYYGLFGEWKEGEPLKYSAETQQKIDDNFKQRLINNPDEFDGNVLVTNFNDSDEVFTLTPSKYSSFVAAQRGIVNLHTPSGTACLVITKDNKLVIGSRDKEKNAKDPSQYPIQFPSGLHDYNEEQSHFLKQLNDSKSDGKDRVGLFFENEGKREMLEELASIEDCNIESLGVIGFTTGKIGRAEMVKTVFALYKINLTFQELDEKRGVERPKDFGELSMIQGISLENIVDILNNGSAIDFDNKNRRFADYQSTGLQLLYQRMFEVCHKAMAESCLPSTSLQQIQDCRALTQDGCSRQ